MAAVFVVLWSSAFIAAVIGTDAAPPLLLVFARFALAGTLLAVLALAFRARWPRGRQLAHLAVAGLLMQGVQFGAFYSAIGADLPGGVVALIQGLNPVVIALLAGAVLGERVSRRQWLGFAIGGAGVALAISDQLGGSPLAVALCFAGLLGLSLGTLYQKRYGTEADLLSGTAVQFLASAPPIGLLSLLLEDQRVTDWGSFGAAMAWIVLVNSVGTYLLLNAMLRARAASRVGVLFFLTPGVTALMAWLVIGQAMSPLGVAGVVVGGVGVLVALRGGRGVPGGHTAPAARRPVGRLVRRPSGSWRTAPQERWPWRRAAARGRPR